MASDNGSYIYDSPIGALRIEALEGYITALKFERGSHPTDFAAPFGVFADLAAQLDEYFQGTRHKFEIKVNPYGTEFRKRVWDELLKIPYGETMSYKELARKTGNENACRAVGGANHHNPVSLIIPCHRVIGTNGSLTGYGGELWRKEWLLSHENTHKSSRR